MFHLSQKDVPLRFFVHLVKISKSMTPSRVLPCMVGCNFARSSTTTNIRQGNTGYIVQNQYNLIILNNFFENAGNWQLVPVPFLNLEKVQLFEFSTLLKFVFTTSYHIKYYIYHDYIWVIANFFIFKNWVGVLFSKLSQEFSLPILIQHALWKLHLSTNGNTHQSKISIDYNWDKVFKTGPRKICERQSRGSKH